MSAGPPDFQLLADAHCQSLYRFALSLARREAGGEIEGTQILSVEWLDRK